MKKILIFAANLLTCIGLANAAVRDGTAISRPQSTKAAQQQVRTTTKRATSARTTKLTQRPQATQTQRNNDVKSRTATNRLQKTQTPPRNNQSSIVARATTDSQSAISETRTGAEYEQCKNTYFSCMDQFCTLKNEDYRRCSCSDRVYELIDFRETLQDANNQLTIFTENLEVVGMTAAQATAMRTETEGEAALSTQASKALLQAIMNSIRGESSEVSGKYSDLNSVNISFDTTNSFGTTDIGQTIATYNGIGLYNAVYPQCRDAVRADCNNASLQRAITAYLMAIEQDCNTVQTAFENTQKTLKKSIREGSAMLDLARVENRQKHNSSDVTTCLNNVESAILSEEVCGANYHKCLDNGEFIDITTGAPIAGVKDFYKLGDMLQFSAGVEAAHQKLAKNPSNRQFVANFEKRVKKFATDALDKCVENADFVWSEFLDKAMLAIYYSQQDKVSEIKQSCFKYISTCYADTTDAMNSATAGINSTNSVILQPDKITLNRQICNDYIQSCNNMFSENIITEYVDNVKDTDLTTACRAVAKQCFDRYGGTNYENFYYPYSTLLEGQGKAWNWFTLKDTNGQYVSECAKQLANTSACQDERLIEEVFGGFDMLKGEIYGYDGEIYGYDVENEKEPKYTNGYNVENKKDPKYAIRPTGVATEVYNQVMSILSIQCMNLQGRFVEPKFINTNAYYPDKPCVSQFASNNNSPYKKLVSFYGIGDDENMCPMNYELNVDTKSWGACLCWENGGRRSKWGKSAKCVPALPVAITTTTTEKYLTNDNIFEVTQKQTPANDTSCAPNTHTLEKPTEQFPENSWCLADIDGEGKVCPLNSFLDGNTCKTCPTGTILYNQKCYKHDKVNLEEYTPYTEEGVLKFAKCPEGSKLNINIEEVTCHSCGDKETLSESGDYCLSCSTSTGTLSKHNPTECLTCATNYNLDEDHTYCIDPETQKPVAYPQISRVTIKSICPKDSTDDEFSSRGCSTDNNTPNIIDVVNDSTKPISLDLPASLEE